MTKPDAQSLAAARVLVLGVGNPLMGDEGVGPRVVEYLLTHFAFPGNVDLVDAGTMGFTILNIFEGIDAVFVVDAIKGTGLEPGTVVKLAPDQMAPNQIMHSLHDSRLTDVLDAAKLMGLEPEVVCIGVQVATIVHWQLELSPVVEDAVARAAQAIVELLREREVRVIAQDHASTPEAEILRSLREEVAES